MERVTYGAADQGDGGIAPLRVLMMLHRMDTALEIVHIQGMTSLVLMNAPNVEKITTGATPSLAGITALQGWNSTTPSLTKEWSVWVSVIQSGDTVLPMEWRGGITGLLPVYRDRKKTLTSPME